MEGGDLDLVASKEGRLHLRKTRLSDRVAGQVISDWMCRQHQEYWQSIPGQKHSKSSLSKLFAERTVEFLKLSRSKARQQAC
jgi:hypothetical protein